VDGWQVRANEAEGICIRQHTTLEERRAAARACATALGLTIPTLVDGMDDRVSAAYAGWPERIHIVGVDGRIAYKGLPGPAGFRLGEAAAALARLLGTDMQPSRGAGPTIDGLGAVIPPVWRVRRGLEQDAVTEMADVVDVWQAAPGRVVLRNLFGEERSVAGYLGGASSATGQLVLTDAPDGCVVPPYRRSAPAAARDPLTACPT
jgi:hypothetical protein